jgi:hypothetical protein
MNFTIRNTEDKQAAAAYIKDLPQEKEYTVSVKIIRKNRTIDQNKLYWLWLSCICSETGNNKDDLHELFKFQYLGTINSVIRFGDTTCGVIKNKSTSTLDTSEFTHYLERIQQFASAELGIRLPNPEDLYFQQFYETYKNYI